MGWWDSLWSSSRSDDPLGKLDPKLREYLEKESPVKYGAANTTTKRNPTPAEIEATRQAFIEADKNEPAVPAESLYQDGRYAHLWKSYKPLAQIENETKSDHEKLMDVLEGFKDRKEQIGRAALENCALEQSDWRSCMSNPSVTERLTLCRTQVKKFEKCYTQQTRLLKALGYLSTADRSPQVEEEIQMHADALYQKMQAQEAEIDAAKAEGRPLPTFEPLIPKQAVRSIGPERQLTPDQQADLRARLLKVPEEERAAEEAAIRAEFRSKAEISARVHGLWEQQEKERIARKAKGEETVWDKVTGVFKSGENAASSNDNSAEKK
ncbi:uncharacterized protein B0I36DRAFT_327631 [Microdochium trichocladiopsis]|uniref:Uncharacterized protein n=1 Tax=Microdochium trichocladiopsis TaxID=1682393 RepID=A0A9P8Y502_9PEZI|nr:uncharacterized protein B0I36DRAFT_327631 [Microdochium trichocladiopsis]KAH7027681.1 hypothetical protein B0I36DRAFT_327631 [Microdochium trichocladiopsis]